MRRILVDRPDQMYVEITHEVTENWVHQPVQEVLVARQQAEMKISAALAELYLKTGFVFGVRDSELVRSDTLGDDGDVRFNFMVHLSADL